MNKSSELTQNINNICEHVGCDSKATLKMLVKVGKTGTISLFLCDSCKSRFSPHKVDLKSVSNI
jgi:Rieske Fe-S protein